ncbi:MAG TPA: 5-methyltetrahydropteroyltriglutamate--homocysteine S-methyltransferase [Burkholderiales bacterium]|nr:5-methyltetrahydropteroyltriglutamate--homocysteine S-methyltransferase [Burkholderiales bacterium]
MLTHNLGYPRIGSHRELKKACESYWSSQISLDELLEAGRTIRRNNWQLQHGAGIDLIPCNDFSFYDQVLDLSLMVGAIPARYRPLLEKSDGSELDLYFAMARGYQKDGLDIIAMEMTKWFDTNYHYLVPEFTKNQAFRLSSRKIFDEFQEARAIGINAKPVLIGPVSYLLLGKEKEPSFNRLDLLDRLLPVYLQILGELQGLGAQYVQIDEPFLALDLQDEAKRAYESAYAKIAKACPGLKIILATYFAGLDDNAELAASLPVRFLHLDLVRAPAQLNTVLSLIPPELGLSLGVVDGRNVWKNDFVHSLALIAKAVEKLGSERVMLAHSCSLLHAPCDLTIENDEAALPGEIKRWLAFARQKLDEVVTLKGLAQPETHRQYAGKLKENLLDMESRRQSVLIHRPAVKQRLAAVLPGDLKRQSPFGVRQAKQHALLKLPLYPTTTIGSFPQTGEVRKLRRRFRKGELTQEQYEAAIRRETEQAIRWQEEIGLDVLVHGEFERNDMVEYFGELLDGFAFTANGWVQSYGSRCVKPPIIYGDVERRAPMTVKWSQYAQSLTTKPVKGMLTGPVTILQWSSVRDDQPRSITTKQIALAIRDEVCDLEKAGIRIIQIDEPAIREGLPLRKAEWKDYLRWAVDTFRLASSGVADETQIHTHMCYSEFNDIIESVAEMDADVITIETSRSQMELLDAFARFRYPNEIGPGVYDIHSPRVPTEQEMTALLQKAQVVLPARNLWVNPDCGLKTRRWPETKAALANMVAAAKALREQV